MSAIQQEEITFAQEKEAFAGKMLAAMNAGGVLLMTSIGHRAGLFDAMATLPPATSRDIAAAAALDERYVREWLGAMVTGGIVDYDAATNSYRLPEAHAAMLTRAAGADNLAHSAQFFAVLGAVEDGILECFKKGGGLPYSAYPRFHDVMAEESNQTVVSALVESILPLAPGLIDRLRRGIDVLDVGCGRGRALIRLAREFPNSRFVGYDISDEALANARAEAEALGLENIRFERRDAAKFDDVAAFDLITAFDAIHDQAKPAVVLDNISRALRADGTFLMQDIAGSSHVHNNLSHPIAPWLYTISCMHCMSVSLAAGGEGLGTMWGEELALEMLGAAGFGAVEVHRLPHDIINCFYVASRE